MELATRLVPGVAGVLAVVLSLVGVLFALTYMLVVLLWVAATRSMWAPCQSQ